MRASPQHVRGFTLIEIMVVVTIIAIIASIAVPNMLAARMAANESAAIATLRQLSSSQAQVKTAAVIDGDGDGVGEYAYFGELSGTQGVRAFVGGVQTVSGTVKVTPPISSAAFGNVNNSVVKRSGYLFQIWLPDAAGLGIPEDPNGGADAGSLPSPDLCETTWCAYAWPVNKGNSSTRVFFINQQGDLLQTLNDTLQYSGATKPLPSAAFAPGSTVNSITFPTCVTTALKTGMDGQTWSAVN